MIDDGTLLNIIRLLVGTSILFIASYTDIKIRRASNYLWLIMGGIGFILLTAQYFTIGFDNYYELLFIPIMIALMYLFFQLRLLFGGADAKALMAIAILVPVKPVIGSYPLLDSLMPYSWVIFSNSIVLFLIIPLSLFIYNIFKRNLKLPYSFLGYKMNISRAKEKFVWPLERVRDGKIKFAYMPKTFDADEEYELFEKMGIKEIWVTPKIPFMIPLFAGFLVSFVVGDLLTNFMQFII